MSHSTSFDFCVLGAGLAGLSISKALLDQGASVCLVDVGEIASGASGTPLGLVNPATGRYGNKVWRAEKCLDFITRDLKEVQEHTPVRFFDKTGILRPAQDEKMATKMAENVTSQDWPEGWCEWLDKDEVMSINPDINCVKGGMWLPHGLTVNVPVYLKAKAEYLTTKGLRVLTNADYSIHERTNSYDLRFSDGNEIQTRSLIFTTGYETSRSPYWEFLPLHGIKGQVAVYKSPLAKEFTYSISALGYIASISGSRFVVGSTYEHEFDHVNPDIEGLDYLVNRMSKVYPRLFKESDLVEQWAGVRVSSPNRKPFLGRHQEKENMYVFAGLGSKGLLYSTYMADLLANFIIKGRAIPRDISLDRI